MLDDIKNFLINYNIKNKTVIIGFSAGPDSVYLSLMMFKLMNEFNLNIILAYFNHGWREEAQLEEEFTKEFAKQNNVSYKIGKISENTKQTEEYARDARYAFFEEVSKEYNSDVVFLAHNKNDNIETLIYRIIKGTSIKGLCSIPEHRDIFYRPLLNMLKSDILNYLKENNQKYLIDSSNSDYKYKRNLIRGEILPAFEKINPKYIESINNLILNSIQSRKIVENEIERIKKEIFKENKIFYEKYIILPQEIRLEILNDYIGKYLKYRTRKNLLMYDDFILNNKHSKTSLNSNYFLRTRWKMIFIEEG